MMKFKVSAALLVVVALICAPLSGWAAQNKSGKEILSVETVSDSAANSVVVTNPDNGAAYMRVKTAAKVGSASLVVTITMNDGKAGADLTVCTFDAITTETINYYLIGTSNAVTEGVDEICENPLPRDFKVVFTITGGSTSFDITSELHYVQF